MKSASDFRTSLRLVERPRLDEPNPTKEDFAQAQLSFEAARLEQNGFPFTAAIKWREAAELFSHDSRLADHCWSEWERIMGLPRGFVWHAPQTQAA